MPPRAARVCDVTHLSARGLWGLADIRSIVAVERARIAFIAAHPGVLPAE